jgi:glyoxylase-like metal-dependent hydrolase (beta-lactamase superfamily II)
LTNKGDFPIFPSTTRDHVLQKFKRREEREIKEGNMVVVAKDDNIQIEKLELGPFGTNAYILTCQQTGDSVLVDAPGEADTIIERLSGTNPKYILMTHNHMDHVGALSRLKSELNVPLVAHASDSGSLPSQPDTLLNDGDVVSFGKIQLDVLHTPGHTPGSLCFLTDKYLISGDTIFPGGPGKTGSPAAFKQVVESITSKIFVLPDETEVHPGHGDSTTLKKEKQEFEAFSSQSHSPDLCGDVLWLSS